MYRGWLALAGAELTNTNRLIDHTSPDVPQSWEEAELQCRCAVDYVVGDDTWPGLREFLGDAPYTLNTAPWYDPAIPQSAEFLGYWATSVEGLGPTPVDRSVTPGICAGGSAGPHRDAHREVTVEVILVACTNAGAEFGVEWLACRLHDARGQRGTTLEYLAAHPGGSAADPALLRRTVNRVVQISPPQITNRMGARVQQQAEVYTCEFQLAVLDPYTYGPASSQAITWDTEVVEGIEWAHPPDCENPGSCTDIPVLASASCIPNVVDVRPVQPPVCSGCIPVCEVETRVAQIPTAVGVLCRDQAVTLTITAGAVEFSGNFWFRPCGSTEMCDRTGFLSIAGLPAGTTIVADAVAGRAYGLVGGQEVRQVGIVHTPSGAPWSPAILDAGECWELVAQTEPGADFTASVSVRGRSA
ncbi:sugar transferase [Nocardia carnea]|uniref:sugar transferase n=1 Tax=Nocardia carnea TaxID=37328 RepID=UPI002454268B|nr:sugar transferase [Nocardia carnea]